MKRTVSAIFLTDVNHQESGRMKIIPSSATIDITRDEDESGKYEKITLEARIEQDSFDEAILYADLVVEVNFDNDDVLEFGTEDIPVRLKVQKNTVCSVQTEYIRPCPFYL